MFVSGILRSRLSSILFIGMLMSSLTAGAMPIKPGDIVVDGTKLTLESDGSSQVWGEKTEYGETTCSREVPDGYQNVCRTDTVPSCTTEYKCTESTDHVCTHDPNTGAETCTDATHQTCGNVETCSSSTTTKCEDIPKTRTETYSCQGAYQVPVLESTTHVGIRLLLEQPPAGLKLAERLDLSVNGETLMIVGTESAREALLVVTDHKVTDEISGSTGIDDSLVFIVRHEIHAKAVAKASIRAALEKVAYSRSNGIVTVTLPNGLDPAALSWNIKLSQPKLFKDKEIFNSLAPAKAVNALSGGKVEIDLTKLGPSLKPGAKYQAEILPVSGEKVLNRDAAGPLTTKTWKTKGVLLK